MLIQTISFFFIILIIFSIFYFKFTFAVIKNIGFSFIKNFQQIFIILQIHTFASLFFNEFLFLSLLNSQINIKFIFSSSKKHHRTFLCEKIFIYSIRNLFNWNLFILLFIKFISMFQQNMLYNLSLFIFFFNLIIRLCLV